MAVSNYDRVGKALELLKKGLAPFVEREFVNTYGGKAEDKYKYFLGDDTPNTNSSPEDWDAAALLKVMWDGWNEIFRRTLGPAERSLVGESRGARNKWAHQHAFTGDDAYRALDSINRLLMAVSAPEAQDVEKMKMELLRLRFDEQVRNEKRKTSDTAIESSTAKALKPWREVIAPHQDVASGRYQQAEFAADLWQVYLGSGSSEYQDAAEFFRRTYLTESLQKLLSNAIRRMDGKGGDPVVDLQTTFGGGKTHSMLAIYHLFDPKVESSKLVGVDELLKAAEVKKVTPAKRVVLVGNRISPGNPVTKKDGTIVRTLWGELAYQLGGKEAFDKIKADDEHATNPGDKLRELFIEYGPCIILIDEWVAYARQLHDKSNLPAGSFATQFTFAQLITEAAKGAKQCLVVISLPASEWSGSPHIEALDEEVGGQRGREALGRLQSVIGRVESSWRPASAEESFEIVRRRLFEPLLKSEQFKARDVVAREYFDLYRSQAQEFPAECSNADYEKRLKDAYPIHPEIFDRLYTDWSTLERFQRTRGVLRLMATVIHTLWVSEDKNPVIMPGNMPVGTAGVQSELARFLPDNWTPVIDKDVDGPDSLPLRTDSENPNLGKLSACRRVARTIYMGSAPLKDAANRGIEDRRIKLGCVMPGESPAIFMDGLRRLATNATFLYQDGPRYWYSTAPTVSKLAADKAEILRRDSDKVFMELDKRLRENLRRSGDFTKVHPLPASGQDVPDDRDARLVVLDAGHPHSRDIGSQALKRAKDILENRGNTPRIYRNTLVFLAADKVLYQDLEEAIRNFLAWESILVEKDSLNLDPQQVKQAESQKKAAETMVVTRIPEAYQWLLVPSQPDPKTPYEFQSIRLSGQDPLAERASRKLKNDELLITNYSAASLKLELKKYYFKNQDHVSIRQVLDDFARYTYFPRMQTTRVLVKAISNGLESLAWNKDFYAYAESYNEVEKRYEGLKSARTMNIQEDDSGMLVKPEPALKQIVAEQQTPAGTPVEPDIPGTTRTDGSLFPDSPTPDVPEPQKLPKRFYGSVNLDPSRVGKAAGQIADEVISHLEGKVGANVTVTLEISAHLPDGADEKLVRTVMENCRTLKFESQGFEEE
ncbi:MAG: DUF499 domain-containing protein [Candidatus Marinimicrobia bacterium]|nr:DUF499 domain-containing protein [Candidatus Neomarinimicrobiota bacterium]